MFCQFLSAKSLIVFLTCIFLAISNPHSAYQDVSSIDVSNDGSNDVASTYDETISGNEPDKSMIIADTTGSDTLNEINSGEETGNQDFLNAECATDSSHDGKRKRQTCFSPPRSHAPIEGSQEPGTQTPVKGANVDENANTNEDPMYHLFGNTERNQKKCPPKLYGPSNFILCNSGNLKNDVISESNARSYTLRNAAPCKYQFHDYIY